MKKYEGSVWAIHSIYNQLVISEISPCKENSFLPLAKELRHPTKGLTDIQNHDNEWFR